MKQTAVEWLITKLNLFNITKEEHYEILCQIELEAKEMEKQQQDELAIEFANWVLNQPFAIIVDKELLTIFKNK